MAAQDYFEHDSPAGVDPHARMAAAGYPVEQATTAENLWRGEDAEATPVRAQAGLMGGPSHRATILRPELRAVGIGIADAAPQPSSARRAAIYTTNFGTVIRSPASVRSP